MPTFKTNNLIIERMNAMLNCLIVFKKQHFIWSQGLCKNITYLHEMPRHALQYLTVLNDEVFRLSCKELTFPPLSMNLTNASNVRSPL